MSSRTPRLGIRSVAGVGLAALVACCNGHRADGVPTASSTLRRGTVAPAPEAGTPGCGPTPCRIFPDARQAFASALVPVPAVLGVGEAHALKGRDGIEPSTRRFTRDLLPLLAGRASDIVIEIMLPNPECAPESQRTKEKQKIITEHQAPTDQNDYVALGTAAKALGIRPHALEPSCDDLARISKAGPDVALVSLEVVTHLVTETLSRLVAANARAHDTRMVVAYGGAMHNDVAPPPETAQFSFGPAMQQRTAGRYTEVDLIVPELIGDSPAWRALPWVPGFDRAAHAGSAALLSVAPRGLVLVFPASSTPPVPSASPR